MTAPELADVWVPIPLRWRMVQPGDVIVGTDGNGLFYVERCGPTDGGRIVMQVYSAAGTWRGDVDPDAVVNVLVPAPERDALTLTREQLAAQVIERRTTEAAA